MFLLGLNFFKLGSQQMKPSKKLNFTINSREKVCSHLYDLIDKESEIIPKP